MNQEGENGQLNMFMCFEGMEPSFVEKMVANNNMQQQLNRENNNKTAMIGLAVGLLGLVGTIGSTIITSRDTKANTAAINSLTEAVKGLSTNNGVVLPK